MKKPARTALQAVSAEFAAVDAAAASVARDMLQAHTDSVSSNRWLLTARGFGRLVAQGLLELGEAEAAMHAVAAERIPGMHAIGRRVRLSWMLRDSVREWERARDRARFAVRRALGPLLAERRPSVFLVAAARSVNDAAGGPLRDREVVDLVRREVFWAVRRAEADARRSAAKEVDRMP